VLRVAAGASAGTAVAALVARSGTAGFFFAAGLADVRTLFFGRGVFLFWGFFFVWGFFFAMGFSACERVLRRGNETVGQQGAAAGAATKKTGKSETENTSRRERNHVSKAIPRTIP